MRLESGPAKVDSYWWIARTVVFLGFALYFVYDGAIGWPGAVRKEAEKQLAGGVFKGRLSYDQLPLKPEQADFEQFRAEVSEVAKNAKPKAEMLIPKDGPPPLGESPLQEPVEGRTAHYFIGKYGYAMVEVADDRIIPDTMKWSEWKKDYNREKIEGQFYWAALPGVFGLYFLYRMIKALTLRAVIDDQGLTYGGERIAWAEMKSLRDYSPKGWVDLHYTHGGQERKLRIDNEKILKFNEIIDEIVREKGFEHPVDAYELSKHAATDEADAEAEGAASSKRAE